MSGVTGKTRLTGRPVHFKRLRKNQILKAGRLVQEGIETTIKTGVGPQGPLKAYAASTRAQKVRQGKDPNRVQLIDSGELLASISREAVGRAAIVKISTPYAAFVDDVRNYNGIGQKVADDVTEYIRHAWMGTPKLNRVSAKGPFSGSRGGPFRGGKRGPFR